MYDIKARIKFYTTQEGGRTKGLSIDEPFYYACVFNYKRHSLDCRLYYDLLDPGCKYIELGEWYTFTVKFLDTKQILQKIKINDYFSLREGSRNVAEGIIMDIAQGANIHL